MPLWLVGNDTCDFSLLKFAITYLVTYHMLYPGEWSVGTWGGYVFCCCWIE